MRSIYRWFTCGLDGLPAPVEAVALRCFGAAILILFIVATFATHPHPGLQGDGLVVLVALVAFVVAAVSSQPRRSEAEWQRIAALLIIAAASAALAAVQHNGIWQAGPYFVGVMAALRLERREAVLTLAFTLSLVVAVSVASGHGAQAIGVVIGAIPWFLVMRLMRLIRDQRDALEASRAAHARDAAVAERGRLAREMHDVLAHSLSALALQLESTRLLARDRGVDDEVARAVDQAHALAAGGLQEARRAIATARGDELPGPERLGMLAEAFGEQSGLPVAVSVDGVPRELAPDARLAVYRTAQEALTNVRRHATSQRVDVRLAYLPDSTVLVVEDHGAEGAPPPAGLNLTGSGYGLTGMRERAELLGGSLEAAPIGDGFRVELRLPA